MEGVDGSGFRPTLSLTAAEIAVKKSHIKALQNVLESDNEWGLIIEDDIFFVNNFVERLLNTINELPNDWHGLWLGGYERKNSEPYKDGITKVVSQFGAFGYVVKKDFAEILIHKIKFYENLSVDGIYSMLQHKYNCYRSVLIGHLPGVSTILNKYVDYKQLRQIDGNR